MKIIIRLIYNECKLVECVLLDDGENGGVANEKKQELPPAMNR